MKRSKAIVAAACLLQLACAGESARKIRVGIPGYTPLRAGDVGEIYVTAFKADETTAEFDVGKELADYLFVELTRKFEGKVFRRSIPADKAGLAGDTEFWKALPGGSGPALFLTGTILYKEEVRKALLETDAKELDGPFRQEKKGLSERRLYTFAVDLALIRAGTGEVVLRKEFKETSTYPDPNLPFSYAYYELSPHFKTKFFQAVFGDERLQERYLFTR
jgi:hypothetical protein